MLILAGVSLNAIVGDNGILTQAEKAKVASEKANYMEQIETELLKYNIDTIVDGDSTSSANAIKDLVTRGILDNFMASDGTFTTDISKLATVPIMNEDGSWSGKFKYVVGKDQYTFSVFQNEDGTFTSEESDIIAGEGASGGEVTGGTTLVTKDTFTSSDEGATDASQKGKYTINGDANVIFTDELEGEYSIYVKSGSNATVSIFKNMTLSNKGIKRSAIDIEPGGTLNLWIAEGADVIVNSGLGSSADQNNSPGKGGYAGIHVPINATLNLYGQGNIFAYGGDAGDSSLFLGSGGIGGSGGGGGGAGIGGNGGNGGQGKNGVGESGKKAEDCGSINIYNTITVNAFGGNCGKGADAIGQMAASGSGYPAAGIGGGGAGGAGGSCCSGGGGFQGGTPQPSDIYFPFDNNTAILHPGNNGFTARYTIVSSYPFWGVCGGSYYSNGLSEYNTSRPMYSLPSEITNDDILSGFGGCGGDLGHLSGCGGTAGKGGTIKKSQNSNVFAYNGSRINDGNETKTGNDEAIIYAQLGINTKKYEWYGVSGTVAIRLKSAQSNIDKLDYVNNKMLNKKVTINSNVSFLTNVDMSKQGIGSGAGYIEVSNGTYTVDASMN